MTQSSKPRAIRNAGPRALSSLGALALTLALPSTPFADSYDDYNLGGAGYAARHQMKMELDVPLSQASMLGSHNTYSTNNTYMAANQTLGIISQLKLGARFIELDVYHAGSQSNPFPHLVVCHKICQDGASGDFTDKLNDIRQFLEMPEYAEQVIVVYIEDHASGHHQQIHNDIQGILGQYVYQSGGGCPDIPASLTPRDVLNAGKRLLIWKDGGCSGNSDLDNMVYGSLGDISRSLEDRTDICDALDFTEDMANGVVTTVNAIEDFFDCLTDNWPWECGDEPEVADLGFGCYEDFSPSDIAQLHELQGKNLVTLDFIKINDDQRAGVWSWANSEPNDAGGDEDCAVQSAATDGWHQGHRWNDRSCEEQHRHACMLRQEDGSVSWAISSSAGSWGDGHARCAALGPDYVFGVPRNAPQNRALTLAKNSAGVPNVWLNATDAAAEGVWEYGLVAADQSPGMLASLPSDFSADGATDLGVLRPVNGSWQWIVDTDRDGITDLRVDYGIHSTDVPMFGDFNGDGATDLGVLRLVGSTWQWIVDTNHDGATDIRVDYGMHSTDVPMFGDFNGDGKTDLGVLRAVDGLWQWIVDTDHDGVTDIRVDFGNHGTDEPMLGDFNGDGKTDFGVHRPVGGRWQWIVDTNHDGVTDIRVDFGNPDTDKPILGDFNGDGTTDFGVLRPVAARWQWIVDSDHDGFTDIRVDFGNHDADEPMIGDFNGDGQTDFGVLRPVGSTHQWIVDTNHNGLTDIRVDYGWDSDTPIARLVE